MKRAIRSYEQKNKIIQEIENNLRMGQSRSPRTSKHVQERFTSMGFQLDLPIINLRQDYAPKSHSISQDKKSDKPAAMDINQMTQQKWSSQNERRVKAQSISFMNDVIETIPKTVLLINHRPKMKSFLRTTSKDFSKSMEETRDRDNEIFLTIDKRYGLQNQIRPYREMMEFGAANPKNTFKSLDQDLVKKQYAKSVVKNIISKEKQKKQLLAIFEGQQIDIRATINSTWMPNNRYCNRNKKKKSSESKRSCSPWNSENESSEIVDFCNFGL